MANPGSNIRLLGICGSLRASSSSAALLRGCERLIANANQDSLPIDYQQARPLDALPHFNPDQDFPDTAPRNSETGQESDPAVARFRGELTLADAVLIATPEYAHGYPGALKNALDWVVGSGQLVHKPVALLVASPAALGGFRCQSSLLQVLAAMDVRLIGTQSVHSIRARLDSAGELADPHTEAELSRLLSALAAAARSS